MTNRRIVNIEYVLSRDEIVELIHDHLTSLWDGIAEDHEIWIHDARPFIKDIKVTINPKPSWYP